MVDIQNPYSTFGRYSADLCLFLLVARHRQLSRAASEAGISQPRVSQRIRFLEDSLGRELFLRERRGVELTPAGYELLNTLLDPMTRAVEAFERFQNKPRKREVVVASDIAFASFLLLPDFGSMSNAFKDLNISVLSLQMPDSRNAPEADLVIRMEPDHETEQHEVCLFRERVSAVCSPTYKAAHTAMERPEDLLGQSLIELAAKPDMPWYTWSEWFRDQGCVHHRPRNVIAFNSYDHVIRAVRADLGIALGWEGLIDIDAPNSGLERAIPGHLESNRGYYLKVQRSRANEDTVAVYRWIADRYMLSQT